MKKRIQLQKMILSSTLSMYMKNVLLEALLNSDLILFEELMLKHFSYAMKGGE